MEPRLKYMLWPRLQTDICGRDPRPDCFVFDGLRFQRYQPPSDQNFVQRNVFSLFTTPDGGLWVGYWFGGVSLIKDGKVTNYGEQEGLPSHAALAFARDRRGTIWIATGREGLARLEGTHWKKIGADWGLTETVNTVFVDHNGTVWVGTPSRVLYLTETATHFQVAAENLQIVMKFAEAPDGTLWIQRRRESVLGITSGAIVIQAQSLVKESRLPAAVLVFNISQSPRKAEAMPARSASRPRIF